MNKNFLALPQETQEQLIEVRQYEQTFSPKELAYALQRPYIYVHYMRKDGFPMPSGLQTLRAARLWLSIYPKPYACLKNRKKPKQT